MKMKAVRFRGQQMKTLLFKGLKKEYVVWYWLLNLGTAKSLWLEGGGPQRLALGSLSYSLHTDGGPGECT